MIYILFNSFRNVPDFTLVNTLFLCLMFLFSFYIPYLLFYSLSTPYPLFTQFSTVINFGHLYMMFDFSGHMWSCAVWKSFNRLSSWWLLCKRYAYTLIRVSRHYYVIRMFLLCLCIFVSNKAFWSWSWSWTGNANISTIYSHQKRLYQQS